MVPIYLWIDVNILQHPGLQLDLELDQVGCGSDIWWELVPGSC